MGKYVGELAGGSLAVVATITQTNEILQTIQLIICIIGALITVGLAIWKVIKVYKEAKKDGKITELEKEQVMQAIAEALDKGTDLIAKINKEENNDDRN